jgi:broad specificity phosphatase PhoE
MSVLTLVRHGQASFGTGHYDALSALGVRQCELLRPHWQTHGEQFDEIWSGSLVRQMHSAELACGQPQIDARWNEYDADAILRHLAPRLAAHSASFDELWQAHHAALADRRAFQRMFEPLMRAWIAGNETHPDVETWPAVRDRVRAALTAITAPAASRRVAVFTSGGPIGIAVMTALGAPEAKALELNWRLRNASLTSFVFSRGRLSLDTFNHTPHLTADLESFR